MSKQCPRLSAAARAKLKERESLKTTAYRDEGGSQAICYGINQKSHPDVFASLPPSPTKEQCDAAFDKVLDVFEQGVGRYPNIDQANQNQRDSLIMRAWNGGVSGALSGIKPELEAGDWNGVAEKMGSTLLTGKDGGDLSKIRLEEKALFLRPVSPKPETESSYHGTAGTNKEGFQTRVKLPNVQIPIGNAIHVGGSIDPSGAPRFQVGFQCNAM